MFFWMLGPNAFVMIPGPFGGFRRYEPGSNFFTRESYKEYMASLLNGYYRLDVISLDTALYECRVLRFYGLDKMFGLCA